MCHLAKVTTIVKHKIASRLLDYFAIVMGGFSGKDLYYIALLATCSSNALRECKSVLLGLISAKEDDVISTEERYSFIKFCSCCIQLIYQQCCGDCS